MMQEIEVILVKEAVRKAVQHIVEDLLTKLQPDSFHDQHCDGHHRHAIGASANADLPGGLSLVVNIGILHIEGIGQCLKDAILGHARKNSPPPISNDDVMWPEELGEVQS